MNLTMKTALTLIKSPNQFTSLTWCLCADSKGFSNSTVTANKKTMVYTDISIKMKEFYASSSNSLLGCSKNQHFRRNPTIGITAPHSSYSHPTPTHRHLPPPSLVSRWSVHSLFVFDGNRYKPGPASEAIWPPTFPEQFSTRPSASPPRLPNPCLTPPPHIIHRHNVQFIAQQRIT